MAGLSYFTIRKSIFGRILGISSTGGLVMGVKATNTTLAGSSDVSLAAQMWGPGLVQSIGAGATLTKITNSGITRITTDSTAASGYSVAAPVPGVFKHIIFNGGGSTLITLNTTDATILFFYGSTAGGTAGSTTMVYTSSTLANASATLVGESTLRWAVLHRTIGTISS